MRLQSGLRARLAWTGWRDHPRDLVTVAGDTTTSLRHDELRKILFSRLDGLFEPCQAFLAHVGVY